MAAVNSLRLVSYNCRGWNNGSLLIRDLLPNCDVCFVQEHWLLKEQFNCLNI